MKLFANGCSYTAGGGLYNMYEFDENKEMIYRQGSQHPKNVERLSVTWPGLLAKLTNADSFTNLAMSGGSNHRIVRTTLDYFYKKIYNGEDISDYVAFIQWTELTRTEFVYRNKWAYHMNTGSCFDVDSGPDNDTFFRELADCNRKYYKFFHSEQQDKIDTVIYTSTLANFFDSYKIPYMFIFLREDVNFQNLDHLTGTVSKFNWYEKNMASSLGYLFDASNTVTVTDGHPNADGHREIADHIHAHYQGYMRNETIS